MGLRLTLSKENNTLYYDFFDAYWHIENIVYTTTQVGGVLKCYPSRESSLKNETKISPNLNIGNSIFPLVDACIYRWDFIFDLSKVFKDNIPLDKNEQITSIYEYVKKYTGLPFKDVYEEEQ